MISIGNLRLLKHASVEDKQVNCAIGFSYEIRPQSFLRRGTFQGRFAFRPNPRPNTPSYNFASQIFKNDIYYNPKVGMRTHFNFI
jgi:hypothetical protein